MRCFFISIFFLVSATGTWSSPKINKESKKIAFLTGKEDAEGGNEIIMDRLSKRGYEVELLIDSVTTVEYILQESFDLLILPSTIGSWRAAQFRDVEIPLMAWESYAFDKELGLVPDQQDCFGGVPFADNKAALISDIEIVGDAHGLSAGFCGKVKVLNAAKWKRSVGNPESNYVFGVPGENAFKIARIGNENRYAIFGYEKGTEMALKGVLAPDKRLAYYFHHAAPVFLTPKGWKLFDAAIDWLLTKE